MGNYGSFHRNSNNVYLSDRGSDWSCDQTWISGPKFRENEYRQALQQYGISHADYVSAVTKADKEGHKALRPCRIIALAGMIVSIAFGALAYYFAFGSRAGGTTIYNCNVPAHVLSNQCRGRNMTNPYNNKGVCCNFWCCGGKPSSNEISMTVMKVQTPKSLELKAKIARGECYWLQTRQHEGSSKAYWADANCQGHGHVEVEGEYAIEYNHHIELPIQPYYFMWMPFVCLIAACIVPRLVYRDNCYRKAIMKVFKEHFAGKVEVSFIPGSKHVPNFVRLHTNRQQPATGAVALVQAPVCHVSATAVATGSTQQVVPVATATAIPVAAVPQPVAIAQPQPATAMPVATAKVML